MELKQHGVSVIKERPSDCDTIWVRQNQMPCDKVTTISHPPDRETCIRAGHTQTLDVPHHSQASSNHEGVADNKLACELQQTAGNIEHPPQCHKGPLGTQLKTDVLSAKRTRMEIRENKEMKGNLRVSEKVVEGEGDINKKVAVKKKPDVTGTSVEEGRKLTEVELDTELPLDTLGVQTKKRKAQAEMVMDNHERPDEKKPGVEPRLDKAMKREITKCINRINKYKDGKSVQQQPFEYTYNSMLFSSSENLIENEKMMVASGTFGVVVKAKDRITQKNLVIKTIQGKVEEKEILITLEFQGVPNIAQVAGLVWTGADAQIILEDAGLSVRRHSSDKKWLAKMKEPGQLEQMLLQLFRALEKLAKCGVAHCDIKPENICMDSKWTFRLIDFGSCQSSQDAPSYNGLTPEYLPANVNITLVQMREGQAHDSNPVVPADDVYALAMVCSFVLKGVDPMILYHIHLPHYPRDLDEKGLDSLRLCVMKAIGKMKDPMPDWFFECDGEMSHTVQYVLRKCLVMNKDKRWKAEDVVFYLQGQLCGNSYPQRKFRKKNVLDTPRLPIPQPSVSHTDMDVKDKSKARGCEVEPEPASPGLSQGAFDKALNFKDRAGTNSGATRPGFMQQQQEQQLLQHTKPCGPHMIFGAKVLKPEFVQQQQQQQQLQQRKKQQQQQQQLQQSKLCGPFMMSGAWVFRPEFVQQQQQHQQQQQLQQPQWCDPQMTFGAVQEAGRHPSQTESVWVNQAEAVGLDSLTAFLEENT